VGPNDGFKVGKLDGRCIGEADVGFPVGLPVGLREGFGVGGTVTANDGLGVG